MAVIGRLVVGVRLLRYLRNYRALAHEQWCPVISVRCYTLHSSFAVKLATRKLMIFLSNHPNGVTNKSAGR